MLPSVATAEAEKESGRHLTRPRIQRSAPRPPVDESVPVACGVTTQQYPGCFFQERLRPREGETRESLRPHTDSSFPHRCTRTAIMQLYYSPTSCGKAAFIAAAIAGVTIETERRVDIHARETASGADFFAINPTKGQLKCLSQTLVCSTHCLPNISLGS